MSLRDLNTDTMVQCSAAWLDPNRERDVLAAIPAFVPLLPEFDKIHQGLKDTESNGVTAKRIKSLSDEQTDLDRLHDRKLRGAHYVLFGAAEMLDDPKQIETCTALLTALCPDGLMGTKKSYLAEGGAAERLQNRLDDEQRTLLGSIQLFGIVLANVVQQWCDAAAKLAQLEAQKINLQNQLDIDESNVTKSQASNARVQWRAMVKTIQAVLTTAKAEPSVIDRILGPLRVAEARGARAKSAGSDAPATEPGDDEANGAAMHAAPHPAEAPPSMMAPAQSPPAKSPAA